MTLTIHDGAINAALVELLSVVTSSVVASSVVASSIGCVASVSGSRGQASRGRR